MNPAAAWSAEQSRAVVVEVLHEIAPEVDLATVDLGADLRTEIDLDSMDFLNLVESIAERTGVQVPESDYEQVRSLDGLVAYVAARVPPAG